VIVVFQLLDHSITSSAQSSQSVGRVVSGVRIGRGFNAWLQLERSMHVSIHQAETHKANVAWGCSVCLASRKLEHVSIVFLSLVPSTKTKFPSLATPEELVQLRNLLWES
jgi:Ni,Fe-hydrogenase III component G